MSRQGTGWGRGQGQGHGPKSRRPASIVAAHDSSLAFVILHAGSSLTPAVQGEDEMRLRVIETGGTQSDMDDFVAYYRHYLDVLRAWRHTSHWSRPTARCAHRGPIHLASGGRGVAAARALAGGNQRLRSRTDRRVMTKK